MKKIISLLGASLLLVGSISTSAVLTNSSNEYKPVQAAGAGTYYDGISDSLTGTDLLNALNRLNSEKRKKTTGYDGMKTASAVFDADPNGSGKIVSFYTNDLIGPKWDSGHTWNREHVWPNARGGSKVEGDAHMTRPASTSINSERGSKGYSMSAYDPGQYVAYYRGMASRIIFYAAIADTSLKLIDEPLNYDGSSPANSMGSLSEMLAWNLQYKPSDTSFTGEDDFARRTELNRNEQIQNSSVGQGNRNPFIDHPEYACRIWGNTNSKTKEICGNSGTDTPKPTPTAITLNNASVTIKVKESIQLSVANTTPSDADKSVTWSSSDSSIATVSTSGAVTGKSVGVVTITATSTKDTNVKATCQVTVEAGEQPVSTYSLVTSNSSLSDNDKVVLAVDLDGGNGISGLTEGSTNASVSNDKANWKEYVVKNSSSSSFSLYDEEVGQYITTPDGNTFKYSADEPASLNVDSNGRLLCGDRYLAENPDGYYRFYSTSKEFAPFHVYKLSDDDPVDPPVDPTIHVTGITLNKTTADLKPGMTLQLVATITPTNATDKSVVWTSENDSIATVTSTGFVTAEEAGTVKITATTVDGNFSASCTLTITENSGGGSGSNTKCGGNIVATSVILSTISLLGVALLLVKKHKEN